MIVGVHQFSRIRRDELAPRRGDRDEVVVFPDLDGRELVLLPELFPVAERGTERVAFFAFELPPAGAVGEAHGVIAGNGLARLSEAFNLISESTIA